MSMMTATMAAAFQDLDLPPPPVEAVRAVIGLSLEECMARLRPQGSAGELARIRHERF